VPFAKVGVCLSVCAAKRDRPLAAQNRSFSSAILAEGDVLWEYLISISGARGRRPWNAGSLVGAKRLLKPRDVWAIRFFYSLRRTKASLIYKATGNPRAVQILLDHSKIENTLRYLGVDIDDALTLAERTEI
jgi:integrase